MIIIILKNLHGMTYVDNTQKNNKYNLCVDRDETVNHIISECSKLAQNEYKSKHVWLGKMITWKLWKRLKFGHADKWYIYKPESVL